MTDSANNMGRTAQILAFLLKYRSAGVFTGLDLDAATVDPDTAPTEGKPTEFALRLAAKDAGLINQIGAATGVPAAAASAVLEFLNDAVARGFGDNDWSDLVLVAEARGNVELTITPKPEA